MGIFLRFNQYFFLRSTASPFKERKRFIKRLVEETTIFGPIHSLIINFTNNKENEGPQKATFKKFNNFKEIFEVIKAEYNNLFSFELSSSMTLLAGNEKEAKIPIKITIWRDTIPKLGHIKIEFKDPDLGFNDFFIRDEKFCVLNKNQLIREMKPLFYVRLGPPRTALFERINFGENATFLSNIKDAFYIWRSKEEDSFEDIMKFRDHVYREYQQEKRRINQLDSPERSRLLQIERDLIRPYNLYYLPKHKLDKLTRNIVLENYKLIDDFIEARVDVTHGSHSMTAKTGTLYGPLYQLNLKINEVYKGFLPTRFMIDENIKKGFFVVFKEEKDYYNDLELRMKELLGRFRKSFKEQSSKILDLKDDWDGSDGSYYKRVTLKRARKFLRTLLKEFLRLYNIELEIPLIFPGMNSEIDLEWETPAFQLLISIPENGQAGAYGDDYSKDKFKLMFTPDFINTKLIAWLARQHGSLDK